MADNTSKGSELLEFETSGEILNRFLRGEDPAHLMQQLTLAANRMDALSVEVPLPMAFALLEKMGVGVPAHLLAEDFDKEDDD